MVLSQKVKWFVASIVWLAVILTAFYGFFWRYVRVFDFQQLYPQGVIAQQAQTQVDFIEQHILPLLGGEATEKQTPILVFHWLNADCKCTSLGKLFIEQMTAKGKVGEVLHVVLTAQEQMALLTEKLNLASSVKVLSLPSSIYQQSKQFVPATPAASIYYQPDQSLSYLGPHSSGVTCGRGSNFIDIVINNLSHGFDPKLYQLSSKGCFCSW